MDKYNELFLTPVDYSGSVKENGTLNSLRSSAHDKLLHDITLTKVSNHTYTTHHYEVDKELINLIEKANSLKSLHKDLQDYTTKNEAIKTHIYENKELIEFTQSTIISIKLNDKAKQELVFVSTPQVKSKTYYLSFFRRDELSFSYHRVYDKTVDLILAISNHINEDSTNHDKIKQ